MLEDLQFLEQVNHLLTAHAGTHVATFEQGICHILFGLMQRDDFLFDGIGGYDAIDGDGFLLSDAVGAVARLLFDGWVPPRVEMNHIVGGSQIETGAARLETDEKERHGSLLELLHELLSL